jgi:hypothetical protein
LTLSEWLSDQELQALKNCRECFTNVAAHHWMRPSSYIEYHVAFLYFRVPHQCLLAHSWLLVGGTLMHTLQHSCLVLSSNQLKHIVLSMYVVLLTKSSKLLFLLTERSPFIFAFPLPLRESWCLIRALGSLEYIWWSIRRPHGWCDPQIRDLG